MYVKCWKKINNILKHDHGEKYMKHLFLFMLTLSLYLKKKIDTCHNNQEKSSTTKVNSILHVNIHYLYIVNLIAIQINMIITEVKTV